jgi:hypothetical protein
MLPTRRPCPGTLGGIRRSSPPMPNASIGWRWRSSNGAFQRSYEVVRVCVWLCPTHRALDSSLDDMEPDHPARALPRCISACMRVSVGAIFHFSGTKVSAGRTPAVSSAAPALTPSLRNRYSKPTLEGMVARRRLTRHRVQRYGPR